MNKLFNEMKQGLFLFLSFLTLMWLSSPAKAQPNIVLIVADDLGYGDLSCYGGSDIKSPNIDKLASEGVRFTNFYSNGPECTPTRAALLSGRYQQRIGGLECALGAGNVARYDEAEWLWQKKELGLPPGENVLCANLKEKKYNTALMGKWHLGYEKKFRPNKNYFDYSFGNIGYGADYFYHVEQASLNLNDFTGAHNLAINGKEVFRDGEYMTDLITQEAIKWLQKQNKQQPFFLYLPFTAPHSPYQTPEDDIGRPLSKEEWSLKSKDKYVKMVEAMDSGIGKILEQLKVQGLSKETLVIFFSDNGGAGIADNGIFRGNKGQVYEGGIHVPCIIKWPGKIEANTISNQTSIGFDITHSILEFAGCNVNDLKLDGYNIIDHVIHKKEDLNRTLFWRSKRGTRVRKAIRDGDTKYLVEFEKGKVGNEALFNLAIDPSEQKNLLLVDKSTADQLKAKLARWEEEVIAPRLRDFPGFGK